ncbi:hypothetical protein C1G87_0486 [Dehalococcoides mccartyi]|uniref:Uncharacterized protein n=1 Tax=Dehalococcoides mccartyi TaxID=61435 RepID=A0A328EQ55_9CHLR|nr:hypothetical protein C1G87_0486 [Dehalococcoides mccartyi]
MNCATELNKINCNCTYEPVKGKASVAVAYPIIWLWTGFRPVLFRIMLKKHMTVLLNASPEWSARKVDV